MRCATKQFCKPFTLSAADTMSATLGVSKQHAVRAKLMTCIEKHAAKHGHKSGHCFIKRLAAST